jgi:hypothetical protein
MMREIMIKGTDVQRQQSPSRVTCGTKGGVGNESFIKATGPLAPSVSIPNIKTIYKNKRRVFYKIIILPFNLWSLMVNDHQKYPQSMSILFF